MNLSTGGANASETTTFRMRRSNVSFFLLKDSPFVCNVASLRLAGTTPESEAAVPVNTEITDTFCVGLVSKSTQRVQFTWMESEKFTLTVTPNTAVLRKGEACEFHATLTALCTTHIETTLQLVSVNVYRGKQHQTPGPTLDVETQLSTSLDADELVAEEQIGKGSFGVVFKGTYRGNAVAIKRLKTMFLSEDAVREFEKEVDMLDKFRCDNFVHFYGACKIPTTRS